MTNNVGLLYVTFARDLQWLDYSLQSFRKYATGFTNVAIVVPTCDVEQFLYLEKKFSTDICPVLIKSFLEYPAKGFVHHLAMKCYGDVFLPKSSFILHMDPDCLWHTKFDVDDYFVGGKPTLLIEPFDAIRQAGHEGRYGWRRVVEEALKFPVTHETMCRHPAVHHRWIYKAVREHMEAQHTTPFLDYVLRQTNKFPHGFCEFNTLGAYALERHRDKYHFIDRAFDGEMHDPIPLLDQMWSYQGADSPENHAKIKKILSSCCS